MRASKPETELAFQLKASGIAFEQEVPAIEGRRFRFDFLCARLPACVLVEIQGGGWLPKGGHTTGLGLERDCEKISMAVAQGYRVLPVTPKQVRTGQALKWIEEALTCKQA